MTTNKPYNEPAFPVQDCASFQYGGMSLRDWFAGQCIMAAPGPDEYGPADYAKAAYALADAMLVERVKP
jgi:hypothetical protein